MNHYVKIELDLLSIPKIGSYYAAFILYLEKQYFTTVFMYMYLYVVMLYSITPKIYCIQIVDLIACGCTNTNSLPTQYFFITPVCFVLSIFFIHVSNNKYVFPCTIYPCPSTLMESFPNLIMNLTDEVTYCKILRKSIFLFVALDICGFVIEYFNGCSWNPNKVYLTVHLRDF